MLINSPRATLPVERMNGAALWIDVIAGPCADAETAAASKIIPKPVTCQDRVNAMFLRRTPPRLSHEFLKFLA
jgi:hypothetical protein